MKIRSPSMLQDCLDKDFSWRIKEIANMKLWLQSSSGLSASTYVRAAVPLLYAHWEGFIKCAATSYANFVLNQQHAFAALHDCFLVLGLGSQLGMYTTTKKAEVRMQIVRQISSGMAKKATFNPYKAGDTKSNLSSRVFDNIATGIGIDTSSYQSRYHLIDESLLRRRNGIAHGEFLMLSKDECRDLAEDVLGLLRAFKTDIENAATMKQYLRP